MRLDRSESPFIGKGVGNRILLAIVATPLFAFSVWGLGLQITSAAKPKTLAHALVQIAIGEFLLALFTVTVFAYIWAFFAPSWLEQLLRRHAARLLLVTGIFVVTVFLAVWFL